MGPMFGNYPDMSRVFLVVKPSKIISKILYPKGGYNLTLYEIGYHSIHQKIPLILARSENKQRGKPHASG